MKLLILLFNPIQLLSFFLFFVGIFGIVFNYKNIILIIISIELCLLSINLQFIISSVYLNDLMGIIFSIIILTVAAAEAAIGLAILVLFYKVRNNILINNKNYLRG